MTIQNQIRKLEEEIKAQKASFAPSLGQLQYPDSTPTASYTGSVDTASQDLVIARLEATFERTDGKTSTPLVDFGFEAHVTPDRPTALRDLGITITGNDLTSYEEIYIGGYVTATTPTTVTFTINVLNAVQPVGPSPKTLTVSVAAYSTVKGTLTMERVI